MLPPINAAGYSPQQILMTLAAISYADSDADLAVELANPAYATQGQWNLVWGPVHTAYGVNLDNLMYVVQLGGTNIFAIAIRGTVFQHNLSTLMDLFEDLEVSHALPWIYPPVAGSLVAGGTLTGLAVLTAMQSKGQSIFDFLNTFIDPTIYVTGHSLGGCLSTLIAPWLQYQFKASGRPVAGIYPYTFAAPSAGNATFAAWYNAQFPISARYFNAIDVVPNAWASISNIKALFPLGPSCPWPLKGIIDVVNDSLDTLHIGYTQPNGNGTVLPGVTTQNPDWFVEVGNQHDSNYYLRLLSAPPINTAVVLQPKTHADVIMGSVRPV